MHWAAALLLAANWHVAPRNRQVFCWQMNTLCFQCPGKSHQGWVSERECVTYCSMLHAGTHPCMVLECPSLQIPKASPFLEGRLRDIWSTPAPTVAWVLLLPVIPAMANPTLPPAWLPSCVLGSALAALPFLMADPLLGLSSSKHHSPSPRAPRVQGTLLNQLTTTLW